MEDNSTATYTDDRDAIVLTTREDGDVHLLILNDASGRGVEVRLDEEAANELKEALEAIEW